MASPDGTSYLDLAGNRVVWHNKPHETIYLEGSNFHDIVPMATLTISALCALCFLAMVMAYCCTSCCGRKETKTNLHFATVFVPLCCMVFFFAVDISNRIMHELQTTISSAYLGIDVGIGTLSNTADGLLQTYLLTRSPIDFKSAGLLPWFIMAFALAAYAVTSIGSRGTQIWSVVAQIAGSSDSTSKFWQYVACAAAGLILLFAIGWSIFAVSFLKQLSLEHAMRRRLQWAIAVLAAAFLGRNIVVFIFFLLYSQFAYTAGVGVQLAYLALYGLLSVVIWMCVLVVAGCHDSHAESAGLNFSPLAQSTDDERYGQPYYSYTYGPKGT